MAELQIPVVSMTTLEIAELTGKGHFHVLRDARDLLVEMHGEERLPEFEGSYGRQGIGETTIPTLVYLLPRRETLALTSGYSLTLRLAIIDKVTELEQALVKPTNQPPHIPYMLVKSIARKRSGWRSTLTDAMVGEMRLQYERLKRHGKAEWGEMRDRVLYLNDAGAMHFAAMLADDDYRSKKTVPTRYPYHMHLKEAMEGSWSNYLYLMRNPEAAQERLE